MSDWIKGLNFIQDSRGKYEISITKEANGKISATLIQNHAKGISVICPLNVSDIYAQCAPERIIERLNKNIADTNELIADIQTDMAFCISGENTPDTPF